MHLITREIGIDAAHRVPTHGSKCASLHGHRYRIEVACRGVLAADGEQTGMVVDFGFLKEEMMDVIDRWCDHGTILWIKDPLIPIIYPDVDPSAYSQDVIDAIENYGAQTWTAIDREFTMAGKLVIVPFIPTAENLAQWWYGLLAPRVDERSEGRSKIYSVQVWETPNCSSIYTHIEE